MHDYPIAIRQLARESMASRQFTDSSFFCVQISSLLYKVIVGFIIIILMYEGMGALQINIILRMCWLGGRHGFLLGYSHFRSSEIVFQ